MRTFGKDSSGKKGKVDPTKSSVRKKSPKFLSKSKSLFSNIVRREFFDQNCTIAYDEKKVAYLDLKTDTLTIYFKSGSKRVVKGVHSRNYVWSPDCTKIAYVKWPGPQERTTQSVWLIDVASGKKVRLYKTDEDIGSIRGIEWAPDGINLYSIEVLEPSEGLPTHRLIRFNTMTGQMQVVRSMKTDRSIYCFFNPPTTPYEYTGKASDKPYQLLYGTPLGFYLASPDGKTTKKIMDFSARGCDNSEWSPDLTQIALNFNGFGKPSEKNTTGLYIYRVQEEKAYRIYKEKDIHTIWWSPNSKILAMCNTKTIWAYSYDPGDDKRPPGYKCIVQIWIPPVPADLTIKVEAKVQKKEKKALMKISVSNKGYAKSAPTLLSIYRDREKVASFPIPAVEIDGEHQVKGPDGKSDWIEVKIPDKVEIEKFWVAVGMERKMIEVSHKNNYVEVPYPPDKKEYTPDVPSPTVLLLNEVMPNQRITGFYWSKDNNKLLITAGRWLYSMVQKDGKLLALPLLQSPKGSFFGRPKFFSDEVMVTTYSYARPEKKEKKRGRK